MPRVFSYSELSVSKADREIVKTQREDFATLANDYKTPLQTAEQDLLKKEDVMLALTSIVTCLQESDHKLMVKNKSLFLVTPEVVNKLK